MKSNLKAFQLSDHYLMWNLGLQIACSFGGNLIKAGKKRGKKESSISLNDLAICIKTKGQCPFPWIWTWFFRGGSFYSMLSPYSICCEAITSPHGSYENTDWNSKGFVRSVVFISKWLKFNSLGQTVSEWRDIMHCFQSDHLHTNIFWVNTG